MNRLSHLYSRFIDGMRRGWPRFYRGAKFAWAVLVRVVVKYTETDGEQRAASFAYYAFFSLFPLLLLLISIGAMMLGDDPHAREDAQASVVKFVKGFIPVVGAGHAGRTCGGYRGRPPVPMIPWRRRPRPAPPRGLSSIR